MNLEGIEMVVFDMAGTTVDEQNVVYKTLHKAIEENGIKTDLKVVLEFGAGKEKHQAIKDVLKHLGEKEQLSTAIFSDFKKMLDEAYEVLEVEAIEGVEQVMLKLKLKGVKVVLNTGYNSRVANLLLKKLGWEKGTYYDLLLTADDTERGRPAPDMIFKAMEAFEITEASSVLKAGDSTVDIEEGKNAGCGITVGVLSGAQARIQLEQANPTLILDSLASLLSCESSDENLKTQEITD